jgi:hypothetical protein
MQHCSLKDVQQFTQLLLAKLSDIKRLFTDCFRPKVVSSQLDLEDNLGLG